MSGIWNDGKLFLRLKLGVSPLIQLKSRLIPFADDQERGGSDLRKIRLRQVRSASSGDNTSDFLFYPGGCRERRRGAGGSPKIPERQRSGVFQSSHPLGCSQETLGQ